MFSAQSEEALSRVLSLTRKFGLFLTLCHQTFSQLSGRLQGALQNSQRIAFRLGRDDSVWAAPRFGSFHPHTIKHTVEDETAQERSHPLFFSVQETYEGWAKALEELPPREAFLRIHTRKRPKTHRVRLATVRLSERSLGELRKLRAGYGQALLTPRQQLQTSEESRSVDDGMSTVSRVLRATKRAVPLRSGQDGTQPTRRAAQLVT